ncbi:hypothetical protein O3M35_001763 [Rhynocoris fuscipes]|uniref:Gem-associated protein 2 n=1 Tax=Rhynocoris fuscipes TaxID=488301 RepID=A0AAW1CRY7_9HEMI
MDEEEETLLEKALVIEGDFTNYDPTEPPTNGHEYLLSVRNEARSYPDVVAVPINRSKFKKQTVYVAEDVKPEISNSFLPSEEWQLWQCEQLDKVRADIATKRDSMNTQIIGSRKDKVPTEDAQESVWFNYCFDDNHHEEKYPFLFEVLQLSQTSLNNLLAYFCNWLQEGKISFTHSTCQWLYAFFCCLEIPLLPDTCCSLRRIAQEAVNVRSKLQEFNEENLIRLNLIICIVGKYFRQIDLADN